jgi:hypothetical protein
VSSCLSMDIVCLLVGVFAAVKARDEVFSI